MRKYKLSLKESIIQKTVLIIVTIACFAVAAYFIPKIMVSALSPLAEKASKK
jgi:hypothetical protein